MPINKSGSSTYNNALMAQGMLREERPEHHLNIHLLDPHTYSMVFGWYLCEMARKLQNGAEIRHVIHELNADELHGGRAGALQPEADEKERPHLCRSSRHG